MIIGTYHLTKSKVSYIMEKQLINHSRNLNKIFLIAPLRYAREVKRIRAQSAKEQEYKGLPHNSPNTADNTKTNKVEYVDVHDPKVVEARRRTAVSRSAAIRPAPQHRSNA